MCVCVSPRCQNSNNNHSNSKWKNKYIWVLSLKLMRASSCSLDYLTGLTPLGYSSWSLRQDQPSASSHDLVQCQRGQLHQVSLSVSVFMYVRAVRCSVWRCIPACWPRLCCFHCYAACVLSVKFCIFLVFIVFVCFSFSVFRLKRTTLCVEEWLVIWLL